MSDRVLYEGRLFTIAEFTCGAGDAAWREPNVIESASPLVAFPHTVRYLDFCGGIRDGVMELRRDPFRMRFTEISGDSFVWLWEREAEGVWAVQWRIEYALRR